MSQSVRPPNILRYVPILIDIIPRGSNGIAALELRRQMSGLSRFGACSYHRHGMIQFSACCIQPEELFSDDYFRSTGADYRPIFCI